MLGGLRYRYALRGDGQAVAEIVPGAEQRRALDALLRTVDPKALTLPERVLRLIPPRPPGYSRTREMFTHRTGLTFDAMTPVEAAATITLGQILNSQRAARLIEYHSRDAKCPGLDEVIGKVLGASWKAVRMAGLEGETQRVVEDVALYRLMGLAESGGRRFGRLLRRGWRNCGRIWGLCAAAMRRNGVIVRMRLRRSRNFWRIRRGLLCRRRFSRRRGSRLGWSEMVRLPGGRGSLAAISRVRTRCPRTRRCQA